VAFDLKSKLNASAEFFLRSVVNWTSYLLQNSPRCPWRSD